MLVTLPADRDEEGVMCCAAAKRRDGDGGFVASFVLVLIDGPSPN